MRDISVSENDYYLAKFLKALGNPVRLAIIKKLLEKSLCPHGGNPCSCNDKCKGENCKCGCKCGELVELFPMSQSTVSQHIKELKNAGLIRAKGRKGEYVLNYDSLKAGFDLLTDITGFEKKIVSENQQCNCCHP